MGGEIKASASVPLLAKGEATGSGEFSISGSSAKGRVYRRRGMAQVIDEIAGSDFAILIDDFHYMPREVQEDVAKQIKEASRQGVKIVTASVAHRSDDVVRANPELRGRVMAIDLDYWEDHNLRAIAEKGFGLLNAELNPATINDFVLEAAGSPQLMQAICLNACFELDLRKEKYRTTVFGPLQNRTAEIFLKGQQRQRTFVH